MQKRSDKDHRKQIPRQQLIDAINKTRHWLFERLEQKGYGTWTSRHEVLGIITEEYTELVEAVHSGTTQNIEAELVDIAVACLFSIACINEKGLDW